MGEKVYYWVMQDLGGSLTSHGPYSSEGARDRRYENVSGGEVHKFSNYNPDPEISKLEFRNEQIRSL